MTTDDVMSILHLAGWSLGEFGTDAEFTVQAHRGDRRISVTAPTQTAAWVALVAYIVGRLDDTCVMMAAMRD